MTVHLPVIEDGYGYALRPEDLNFLRVAVDDLHDCGNRLRPYGMTTRLYEGFVNLLSEALARDGLTDCDVRLQGSSVRFFSGHHKTMPWSRAEIVEEFRYLRRRVPQPYELDEIQETLDRIWPSASVRPTRRPFDSMYRCGIDRDPSDYDVQISSREINARVQKWIRDIGIPLLDTVTITPTYSFFRKDLIVDLCPALTTWAMLQSDILGRLVAIAAFPEQGPPNVEDSVGPVSSHFRVSDWMVL